MEVFEVFKAKKKFKGKQWRYRNLEGDPKGLREPGSPRAKRPNASCGSFCQKLKYSCGGKRSDLLRVWNIATH
jgi:hypothetical protein